MARLTKTSLTAGLAALAERDPDVARALGEVGPPALRKRAPGFGTLLRAIVGQQVSVASASAIWGRLEAACPSLAPEDFLGLNDAAFRAIGFSRQKEHYGRGMAEDLLAGRVDLKRLGRLDDEDAIAELVRIKGIGRWSAEIYLLFAHGRPDVWPIDDVGLMVGMEWLKRLGARPDKDEMRELGEAWRPWRGAAAHLLWHYRHNAPPVPSKSTP